LVPGILQAPPRFQRSGRTSLSENGSGAATDQTPLQNELFIPTGEPYEEIEGTEIRDG
jgi:hypothetical protein